LASLELDGISWDWNERGEERFHSLRRLCLIRRGSSDFWRELANGNGVWLSKYPNLEQLILHEPLTGGFIEESDVGWPPAPSIKKLHIIGAMRSRFINKLRLPSLEVLHIQVENRSYCSPIGGDLKRSMKKTVHTLILHGIPKSFWGWNEYYCSNEEEGHLVRDLSAEQLKRLVVDRIMCNWILLEGVRATQTVLEGREAWNVDITGFVQKFTSKGEPESKDFDPKARFQAA
jgi:hypothetical protein